MSKRPRKLPSIALAVLVVATLGGCGDSHTRVTTGTYAGESGASAPYLNVGPLVYQVQLSRELNPYDTEDEAYLEGLTPAQRRLAPGEEWFGMFIQVYNNSHLPVRSADVVTITDAVGNVYTRVMPGPSNQFAYRPEVVAAKGRLPVLDSVAASGPTQGLLLLYRIPVVALDNRPLKMRVVDPTNPALNASAELDV
jgi:hypothetical protein